MDRERKTGAWKRERVERLIEVQAFSRGLKMKEMKRIFWVFICCVITTASVFIFGCGQHEAFSGTAVAASSAAVQKAENDIREPARSTCMATDDAWSYNPAGKRNPFEDLCKTGCCGKKPVYGLSQMLLDGIIKGQDHDVAHIRLPDKRDLYVKTGDEIGPNKGRVKQITENEVVVEEIYVDPADPSEIHVIEKIIELTEGKKGR